MTAPITVGLRECDSSGCHAVINQTELELKTRGRGTYDLTSRVQSAVEASGVEIGMCHVFIRHTSASLMLCENADPAVMRDLETFMLRLAPDGDPMFSHTAEGPDDMPAHVRSILTQSDLNIPVRGGRCDLGTWQGIYLWEHRFAAHRRLLTVTVQG
jgi:secondary thiamine-phosphate synthase enzyme